MQALRGHPGNELEEEELAARIPTQVLAANQRALGRETTTLRRDDGADQNETIQSFSKTHLDSIAVERIESEKHPQQIQSPVPELQLERRRGRARQN
jgi:hypothetical protein